MKILIAFDENPDKEKRDSFRKTMTQMLCGLDFGDVKITESDIVFGTTSTRIEPAGITEFDIVIAKELVDGVRIGPGRVKQYFANNPDLKLILIVDKEKKSSGKLNALYKAGYYDVLLSNDFKWKYVERLIYKSRTEEEAWDYYGLALYSDYSKVKLPDKENIEEVTERGAGNIAEHVKNVEVTGMSADVMKRHDNESVSAEEFSVELVKNPDAMNVNKAKSVQKGNENEDKKTQPAKASSKKETKEKTEGTDSKGAKQRKEDKKEKSSDKAASKESKAESVKNNNDSSSKPSKKDKAEKKDKKKDAKESSKAADKELKKASENKTSKDEKDDSKVSKPAKESKKAEKEEITGEKVSSVDVAVFDEYVSEQNPSELTYDDTEYNYDEYDDYGEEEESEELLAEDESKPYDAMEYLLPAMGDNIHITTMDWENEGSEADMKKYIRAIEKKALNPVRIKVELDRDDEILEELLKYYTEEDTHWISDLEAGILSQEHFAQHLWQRVQMYEDLTDEDMEYIFRRFSMFMWGYDVITPLIEDPTISDIALVAYDNIQVKRYGKRYFSTLTFRSPSHFTTFINHILRFNHVDLSDKKPDKTFMDTSTSAAARMRFVYSQEYINAGGNPSLIIRKVPTKKYTLGELVDYRMMDYRTASIILEEVRRGGSIIWTGTMASGKTSQMNTYLDFIRHDKRGLVMQENEELFSNTHPLLQFQNIRPSQDGETLYDLRYLATFGLLMDLNYFIIGEIKGSEAEQFTEAVYTNTTCWGSVHSISARDALPRIATLAVTKHFSEQEQLRKLSGGITMVVYLDKFVVEEIVRVKGWDEKNHCTIYEDVEINIPPRIDR